MRTPRLLAVLLLANCDLPCPNDQPREGCSCPRGSRWARDTGDSGWYGTDDTGAWRPRGDGSENDRLYLTSHAAEFRGVAEGDGFGAAIASLGDRDGDGLAELLVGAPEADAVYLLAGDSLTQGGQTAPGDAWLEGEAGDAFGYATALAGDLDGDGTPDVAIGAPGRDDHAGAAVVALDDGTLTLTGERPGDYAGGALAGAGDVDGDGLADLLVGAWGQDGGATRGGAVYVVLGDALGDGVALADASATLVSGEAGAYLGSALAGGHDYTGDGLPEVVVAAPDAQDARGVVWIVAAGEFAPGEAVDVESFAFASITGASAGDWAGDAVSLVGDLDGDGLAELLVGAPGADDGATDGGAAWRVSGASIAAGGDVTDADGAFVWPGAAGWAGMAVGGDADFALVGVPADGTLGYGAGAVWQLAWSGDTEVAGAAGLVYHGDDADAHAGVGVVPLADLDGEGGAFATGAPGFDHGRGAVYVAP